MYLMGISSLWSGELLDEEALEAAEDTLIGADVGAQVAMEIIEEIKEQSDSGADGVALKAHLRNLLLAQIGEPSAINTVSEGPLVLWLGSMVLEEQQPLASLHIGTFNLVRKSWWLLVIHSGLEPLNSSKYGLIAQVQDLFPSSQLESGFCGLFCPRGSPGPSNGCCDL